MRSIFFLLLLIGLGSAPLFSKGTENNPEGKPKIYLVGAVHHMHFKPGNNYSINDLLTQLQQLKPDVVCGEIAPEAFNQEMEGYFPPEAAILAEMADEFHYRFVPVDWRLDYATQFIIANNYYPDSVQKLRSLILNNLQTKLDVSNSISQYDVIHQESVIKDLDSLYEKIIRPDPIAEIASGSWHERNRRIIENGLLAAGNAHTVVFVFGLDHLPGLQRELLSQGYESEIPRRLFEPGHQFKLPKEALDRWKRNLENLKSIRDKTVITTYDNYQKVINCNRIKDLENAIQISK